MNPNLLIAIINLVGTVGLDAAAYILDGLKNAKSIEEAIAALQASAAKDWEAYKREAAIPPVPPAPPTP